MNTSGWSGGRGAQSMAFSSTPGMEELYSGVTISSASAAAMRSTAARSTAALNEPFRRLPEKANR